MRTARQKGSQVIKSINPFNANSPARGIDLYGRSDNLAEIETFLNSPCEIMLLIYGQRRTGKTSLLLSIKDKYQHLKDTACIYYDLQNKSKSNITEILIDLINHISFKLNINHSLAI